MADPEHLREALERLRTVEADGEAATRLETVVSRLQSAVDSGRTLDHGTVARYQNTLNELTDAVDNPDPIREAREALSTYREGVEGV